MSLDVFEAGKNLSKVCARYPDRCLPCKPMLHPLAHIKKKVIAFDLAEVNPQPFEPVDSVTLPPIQGAIGLLNTRFFRCHRAPPRVSRFQSQDYRRCLACGASNLRNCEAPHGRHRVAPHRSEPCGRSVRGGEPLRPESLASKIAVAGMLAGLSIRRNPRGTA